MKKMTFITNNFKWSANSISDLYKARWAVEVFFKEIKQTLKLSDFVGYNKKCRSLVAIDCLVDLYSVAFYCMAEQMGSQLYPVIYRAPQSDMGSSGYVQRALIQWTTGGKTKMRAVPEMAYLPGLAPTQEK